MSILDLLMSEGGRVNHRPNLPTAQNASRERRGLPPSSSSSSAGWSATPGGPSEGFDAEVFTPGAGRYPTSEVEGFSYDWRKAAVGNEDLAYESRLALMRQGERDFIATQQEIDYLESLAIETGITNDEAALFLPAFYEDAAPTIPRSVGDYWLTNKTRKWGPNGSRLEDSPGSVVSFGEAHKALLRADPDTLAYYQGLMVGAGFLPESFKNFGEFTAGTETAWKRALQKAALTNQPILNMLQGTMEDNGTDLDSIFGRGSGGGGGGGGGGGAGPRRPTVQVTSDADAQELIDQILPRVLGRKLRTDEKAIARAITETLQSTQRTEQNKVIDQQLAGGGSVEAPTNPQTIVKNEAEEHFEEEAGAWRIAQAFGDMMQMMG